MVHYQSKTWSVTNAKHDLFSYQCKTSAKPDQLPMQNIVIYQCSTKSVTRAKQSQLPEQNTGTRSVTRCAQQSHLLVNNPRTTPVCHWVCNTRSVTRQQHRLCNENSSKQHWQSVQRERLGINPFTAPASNTAGWKDAWTHLQTAHFLVL